jgi:very-short-patch-repair endonuclease
MRELGRNIASLATRQHGVVSRRQLLDEGLDRGRIDRAIANGHLLPLHVGVYAVGHRPRTDLARWKAATLACDGVLSYHSAGAHFGLPINDNGFTHVTAPRSLRRPYIHTHRSQLHPDDHTTVKGIPVTTMARTLIDLDRILDDKAFDRLVREAMFQRRFNDTQIREALTRKRSLRLRTYLSDQQATQSDLEDLLLRICDRHRIPRPQSQRGTNPRVDFIWHAERLIVEADGWLAHGTRHAFQRDRTTTNALQLAGYTVLRFTEDDLKKRPRTVATQIRQALRG